MRKDRDFILRISKVLKESYNISVDIKFRWLGEGRCDIDDCDFCGRFLGGNELVRYDNNRNEGLFIYENGEEGLILSCNRCRDIIAEKGGGIDGIRELVLMVEGDDGCYECGSRLKTDIGYFKEEDVDEDGKLGGDGWFELCDECCDLEGYLRT